jgi:hypothetical protein
MTFRNNASYKERVEILKEERRQNTMLGRSQLDLLELGGRYKRQSQVIGTEPPIYPAASSWTEQDPGLEPVLGYSIQDQEAVGTQAEIAASLERSRASAGSLTTTHDDRASTLLPPLADVVRSTGDDAGGRKASPAGASPVSTKPKPVFRRPVHEQS